MRTWQITLSQLLFAIGAVALLASIIHFPDVARRPMPPPSGVFFFLLILVSAAILAFAIVGARSARVNTKIVFWSSLILWLLGCYALAFVWINTFGT
jgi:drug/metabolite transporter (DMT)-like permease